MNKIFFIKEKFLSKDDYSKAVERIDSIKAISLTYEDLGKEINYRQLIYWFNEGLLLSDPRKEKLKNLDFIDYCWIHMVNIMRSFGMSVKAIKEIKETLMTFEDWLLLLEEAGEMENLISVLPPEEKQGFIDYVISLKNSNERVNEEASIFFLCILDFVISRSPIAFLVNTNNQVVIFKENEYDLYVGIEKFNEFFKGSYLKISLNEIIWRFLRSDGFEIKDKQLEILTEPEQKILKAVRDGGVNEITIRFENDVPKMLEVTHRTNVEVSSRLLELIKAGSYMEINIKTQDGRIVCCENTIKQKL